MRCVGILFTILVVAAASGLPEIHAEEPLDGVAGDRGHWDDLAPKQGEVAPDFTLKSIDGRSEVTLSGFKGKKPVVLIFGSWT